MEASVECKRQSLAFDKRFRRSSTISCLDFALFVLVVSLIVQLFNAFSTPVRGNLNPKKEPHADHHP